MEKKIDITLDRVIVTFPAGTHISQCIREAVSFSALENCEVTWEHNEQTIVVDARDMVEKVYTKFIEGKNK